MNIVRRKSPTLVVAAALSSLLFLGGCGSSTPEASGDTSPATSAATPSTKPVIATPSSDFTATTTATPSETATPSPTPTDSIQNRCTAGMLSGEIVTNPGAGAASGVLRQLVLTNTGSKNCVLHGWAGVSFVANGDQVGAAAERASEKAPVANELKPGASAAAGLMEKRAGKYTECEQVKTTAIRVYPPEDTSSLLVPFKSTGCSNDDIKLLTIGTFQPYTPAK